MSSQPAPAATLRAIVGLAFALGLATTLACGGGAADGAGDPQGIIGGETLISGTFVPDESTPAARSVGVTEASAHADLVTLAVQVTDTQDIFTVGFDLDFDPTRVEYVSWSPGTLLETGGQGVIYNVAPYADRVVVGASRVSPAAGVDAVGSRAVVKLTFRVTVAGSSPIGLARGSLLDSQPPGPSEIPGVSWSGGRILAN